MSTASRKRPLPSSSNRGKVSRRKKPLVSEDEDSNDSTTSNPPAEQSKPSTPEPEECTTKLPEELLKTFYKTPGVLMIAGLVSWDLTARRDNNPTKRTHPNLYTFHKFTDRRYRLIVSGCTAGHSVLVSEEGEAYTFGRNACGQLGFGDTVTRSVPELVPELKGKNIIHAAVGRHHTLFVTDTGCVYACGDNKSGQCGLGNTTPQILKPTRIKYNGTPIVKVGCGAEFSMILDCNGNLHSFGMPEYGQLGHNTDGKYFVTSTKLSFHFETIPKQITLYIQKSKDGYITPVKDVTIVDLSCGNNHTVAIDSMKRAFSWGFGGFGRLGHAEQKDENVPRLIKYFDTVGRGVRSVHCGGTYSLAVNDQGALFMFGQTKRTGEANMYPKPVHDLTGWNIKSVGTSNTSIVIAADDSLIAWGVSPTYGELGMGEINKSTAKPKEVSRMDSLGITQVAMGYSHTLLLCDNNIEEVKQKLDTIPAFEP
ncbi:protein RCC2 homolog [Bombyx mandarina]|uniref:RCC1-like domain-containing protein n=2 Tax=Bombyx TaxID=7090 RepID=A0A8R2C9M4_BOMMO|nr:protein RCC2 homolog [Bombyx mori]XP_028034918.1 protein RCC2 homolog [Bombyx mandarina]XP_028034927.1 protein RCC2 homolog [Bombyx mandarina]